jgi:hypothetical protein
MTDENFYAKQYTTNENTNEEIIQQNAILLRRTSLNSNINLI